jgi:hypothetical protein
MIDLLSEKVQLKQWREARTNVLESKDVSKFATSLASSTTITVSFNDFMTIQQKETESKANPILALGLRIFFRFGSFLCLLLEIRSLLSVARLPQILWFR